jgi:hypothetical protein
MLTPNVIHDISEFVTASVPRELAQGLMAELLGQSLPTSTESTEVQLAQFTNPIMVESALNDIVTDTISRIDYADAKNLYTNLINTILSRIYSRALDLMATDAGNQYTQKGEIDPHFILI